MLSRSLVFLATCLSCAAVTRVELVDRTDVAGGASYGAAGPYECITARAYFAVDPKLPRNRIIADIDLAPRNAEGLVEFSADVYVLKPRDPAKGNRTALFEISNRGGRGMLGMFDNSDNFLFEQGFTLVWIGWEFDVPGDGLKLYAPTATNDGAAITGLVRSEWIGSEKTTRISLGDRSLIGYPVADPGDHANIMYVRERADSPRHTIARSEWTFDADARHVSMPAGFAPGNIYEVVYKAKDPVLVGLGPAAVRDFASFLKHGGPETLLNDQQYHLKRALGFGTSQSGRFLRTFLYEGFNADEKGQRVFDGVWAHVAGAGRGGFNFRFAQPSRDGHPFLNIQYPVDIPPYNDEELLAKTREQKTTPKIFYTNGSYEYWGRAASLIHTTPDGKSDAAPAPDTRIYFLAGTQHGPGSFPPSRKDTTNLANPNDYRPLMRALLVDMQAWLKDNREPPPSRYPLIAKGELVPLSSLHFPTIADAVLPTRKREGYALDFSTEPPRVGRHYPTLVPQTDADGNDLGGVRLPEIAVPMATYTGWNLRDPSTGGAGEMYSMVGSWFPFTRVALDARYGTKQAYLDKIDAAAAKLVRDGFLLPFDAPRLHERAAREFDSRF